MPVAFRNLAKASQRLARWRHASTLIVSGLAGVALLLCLTLEEPHWLQIGAIALLCLALYACLRRLWLVDAAAASGAGALERVQRHYSESEQRFRALLESLPKVAVQGYDRDRRVIYWNSASTELYGYQAHEAQGELLEDLIIPPEMRTGVIEAHRAWVQEGVEIPASELELKRKGGETVAVFSHHVMLGEHTAEPLMFCVDVDLSVQKQARRDLDFITRFDALTMLPNRPTYESQLDEGLRHARRMGEMVAVAFVDISGFAEINDAEGYEQGDRLLVEVAHRLRGCQRGSDLLARFGADEFVMAFPHLRSESDALTLVDKLLSAFHEPFDMGLGQVHINLKIGVSLYPDNGQNARELIQNADVAKNRAKLASHQAYWFFDQGLHDELIHEYRMAERLQRALRDGELCLHYQPQVAASSGRVENLEALIRWFPSEGGSVSPGEFIPVAERSNLIHRIGEWVIREACRQQAEWKAEGLGDCRIDINLSGKQVIQHDVFAILEACMKEFGLTVRDIGIELTENVLIKADQRVLHTLRRLYHQGMKIAIDDFGTGYSSLSYLKQFPITALKIDRSFVRDAPDEPSDRAIMAAMVFIGHQLGLEVVAEGVETEEQLELIREFGCDLVQGYYYFRPMGAEDIGRLQGSLMALRGQLPHR
ncbi:EAL domain-containing protein [Halomonas sp. YLGW01]|uniref:putative bifunctional diguanylate cyclase/phosphodiesterase n=1 Tax=Halomonas sp. YLGW01 TaxID=2773308 RepID=UPI0024131053|nr:EAL domain-containing protein [Halomonas sp. YLGW01]